MATLVNLDALIPREDFEVESETQAQNRVALISIKSLESADFFYVMLRKPDFQRETADWTPKKISDFIKSFLDDDLIPAIILWQSGGNNFVIDGAHRLSALIAWVNDDYGDKTISRTFFEGRIADEQVEAADVTRKQLRKLGVDSYDDHKLAILNPEKYSAETVARARRLGTLALQLQWVQGNSSKAEASFFKINQQAAPIDPTELKLLKARKSPNAMAARAIIRSGTGHKYWSKFNNEIRTEIQDLAKAINGALFIPKLSTPIKTLDLPVAGRGYSAQTLPLIFELVNLANDLGPKDVSPVDPDGQATISFLKATKRIVDRINGNHSSSLGLHPAVYFYSETGRYQPTAFLSFANFVKELEATNQFRVFTDKRSVFEDFLLENKVFANQVTVKYGSGSKGFPHLHALYRRIFGLLVTNKTPEEILTDLVGSPEFSYLQPAEKSVETQTQDFSANTKSAAFLRDALASALKCKICGGLIHAKSISIDHKVRKEDGGGGNVDNAQLSHFYCNTTVKN